MDHYDELHRRFLEGEMTAPERQAFLAGLPEDERHELDTLRQMMAGLEELPPVEVPTGMLARIEAAIAAAPMYTATAAIAAPAVRPSLAERVKAWFRSPPAWGWSAAGFSAAMVLMLLVGNLRHPNHTPAVEASTATPAVVATAQPAAVVPTQGETVTFKFYAPQAQRVAVIGEFNGWGAQPATVLKRGTDGQWQATVALPPGQYQYAFLVNDHKIMADPQAMAYVQDDYGHKNAVLTLL